MNLKDHLQPVETTDNENFRYDFACRARTRTNTGPAIIGIGENSTTAILDSDDDSEGIRVIPSSILLA
jgi:hypothetical protein